MNPYLLLLLLLLPLLALTGCRSGHSTADIPAVSGFNTKRYLGEWYEIARLPNSFENGMTQVKAKYKIRPDGVIEVENSGIRDGRKTSVSGVAFPLGDATTGELQVSFFRPFYGDYRIIRLEPDYSAAIVTSGTRDHLWILSRTRTLSHKRRGEYLNWLRRHGFDTEKLIWLKPVGDRS